MHTQKSSFRRAENFIHLEIQVWVFVPKSHRKEKLLLNRRSGLGLRGVLLFFSIFYFLPVNLLHKFHGEICDATADARGEAALDLAWSNCCTTATPIKPEIVSHLGVFNGNDFDFSASTAAAVAVHLELPSQLQLIITGAEATPPATEQQQHSTVSSVHWGKAIEERTNVRAPMTVATFACFHARGPISTQESRNSFAQHLADSPRTFLPANYATRGEHTSLFPP